MICCLGYILVQRQSLSQLPASCSLSSLQVLAVVQVVRLVEGAGLHGVGTTWSSGSQAYAMLQSTDVNPGFWQGEAFQTMNASSKQAAYLYALPKCDQFTKPKGRVMASLGPLLP